jgi:hypothetical protein
MKNSSGEVIVDFCFRRAGRIILAASALVLIPSFVTVPSAQAHGQAAAAGQKNWKDRDEYDAFQKVTQTTDMKARLEALKAWEDKYPTSDFVDMRNQYFLDTYNNLSKTDPAMRQALLNKAQDSLKNDPKNANTLYLISLWGPIVGGANPPADLVSQVESAAHAFIAGADEAFSDDKKPANLSAENWKTAKAARIAKAHQALAWAATTKKDYPTAESEYRESLTVYPDDAPTSSQFARMLYEEKDPKKIPESLFEYARAGEYSGPGPTLPAAGKTAAIDFFNKLYKNYHGSDDGKDQILTQAKTSALPPAGYSVVSINDLENDKAKAINDRIAKDPGFGLWFSLKQQLTGDNGPAYFSSNVKDAELPGGANGVKTFSGTILTVEPADKPTRVTVGIEDPTKADATLLFTNAIPTAALSKIKVGEKVEFSGVADSFTKDPYMLTFKDPDIPGVQLAPPPPRPKGRKR